MMPYEKILEQLGMQQEDMEKLLDKEWRMDNLYTIIDKDGKLITFKRNRAQKHFNQHRWYRNIILKSRQLGFTTYEALDMFDDVLFNPNFHSLMLSYDIPSQLDIFDGKIKFAWDRIPEVMQKLFNVDTDRANELKVADRDWET